MFPHGVASGDPLSDRVVLWTRVTTETSDDVPVAWVVARDAAITDVMATGEAVATLDGDFSVSVDVGGLEPDTPLLVWVPGVRPGLTRRSHADAAGND